jgi:23S rRNA (adenine2030-N6)-methyltransferase
MKSIKETTILCNPGVLGSGILAANLSQKSYNMIFDYCNKLVELYKNVEYKGYDGSLFKDVVKM